MNIVETFHDEGQIDMFEAMKAYIDIGFKGPLRPDHVPTMAGDSNQSPGYTALGSLYAAGYIRGLRLLPCSAPPVSVLPRFFPDQVLTSIQ